MEKTNLTVKAVPGQSAKVLIDGHTVRLHFAVRSPENTLGNIRQVLLNAVGDSGINEKRG